MSHCQLEPNILSFEVPYSEGVTAHRKGRDCLDCQRIWKGDKDLPVSICLQLSFFPILYNHTHKASVGHITVPSPSVIIVFFFFLLIALRAKRKDGQRSHYYNIYKSNLQEQFMLLVSPKEIYTK